ncbi:MAG: DUF1573 domain-containing protein [Bacteroidota bacterium]
MTSKLFFSIISLLLTICLYGQESVNNGGGVSPEIIFENPIFDYGTVPYDSEGTCEFKFKNTGNTPLILSNVQSSCGCTVPNWPKVPIQKNATGTINVKYNTTRPGNFQKTITVYSNAKNSPLVLTIKGTVEKKSGNKTSQGKEKP